MMTADQLCELERSAIVEQFPSLFASHVHHAYKYHSLSLAARAVMREFTGPTFLLRNYTDTRWDKRLVIHNYSSYARCSEVGRSVTNSHTVCPQNKKLSYRKQIARKLSCAHNTSMGLEIWGMGHSRSLERHHSIDRIRVPISVS